jgi:hypothetical protein
LAEQYISLDGDTIEESTFGGIVGSNARLSGA